MKRVIASFLRLSRTYSQAVDALDNPKESMLPGRSLLSSVIKFRCTTEPGAFRIRLSREGIKKEAVEDDGRKRAVVHQPQEGRVGEDLDAQTVGSKDLAVKLIRRRYLPPTGCAVEDSMGLHLAFPTHAHSSLTVRLAS